MTRTRHERIVSVAAKRPPSLVSVEVTHRPQPEQLGRIAKLLLALLDDRSRSGRT